MLDPEVNVGENQHVVCPSVSTTNGLCYPNICNVPGSSDDIVNEVPVLGPRLHLGGLFPCGKTKQCISDDKVMHGTCPE